MGNQSISGKQKYIQNQTGVIFVYAHGKRESVDKIHGFGIMQEVCLMHGCPSTGFSEMPKGLGRSK